MTENAQPCPEAYWLPGEMFAAGPYPAFDDETIRSLLDAGIRAFIDLTQEHELEPYDDFLAEQAEARNVEVSYARFPIRDGNIPDVKLMERILDSIADAHAAGRPVYVHCWGGIGRTGTVAACYLIEQGHSSARALEIVQSLYRKHRTASAQFPRSPETDIQHRFVRTWKRQRSSAG